MKWYLLHQTPHPLINELENTCFSDFADIVQFEYDIRYNEQVAMYITYQKKVGMYISFLYD